jgi:hypothetical protein
MKAAFMRYIRFFRNSGCIGAGPECETHNKSAALLPAHSPAAAIIQRVTHSLSERIP